MPIQIQGNWTITVQVKNPLALPQRFIITGAQTGNGTYNGFVGATPVFVTGNNWTLNIQANEDYELNGQWINSTIRPGQIQTIGTNRVLLIESEDLIQDNSFDDLVLRLTQPIAITPPAEDPVIMAPPTLPPPDPYIPTPPPPKVTPPEVVLPAGKVFTRIDEEDRLPRQKIATTVGIWSENSGSLIEFFTCSLNPLSSSYQISVLNKKCNSCNAEVQFNIAYGHDGGSGSYDLGGYDWLTPTNAIYGQYRQLLLPSNQSRFKIGNRELHHIYVINIAKDRLTDRLDEGNIELNIAMLSGSFFEAGGGFRDSYVGSTVKLAGNGQIIRLIDDSGLDYSKDLNAAALSGSYSDIGSEFAPRYGEAGPVYYMVSGSLEEGVYQKSNPSVYGLVYPKMGMIVLDGDMMDSNAGFLTVTGSDLDGQNAMKLFTAVSGAALYTDSTGDRLGFQARKLQYNFSEFYFIRVKNFDYNFTNNPTYQTGSEGMISDDFQNNPQVYITQIGLYNPQRELLAVAKISQPILKNYVNEGLFAVKLSY